MPCRAKKYKTCSLECMAEYFRAKPNVSCCICGKEFHLKPYKIKISKTKEFCCNRECDKKHRSILMLGERNHQYGLIGDKNSSFKYYETVSSFGYITLSAPDHPFRNRANRVFQHRLIAEKYLLNEENSIEIDGIRYLRPELHVHHIDQNKQNNNPDNLQIMTREEHMSFHSKLKPRQRDSKGRFVHD